MPELLHQLSDQTTTLIRQEFELLRAELAQKGKVAGQSAGLFAASSLFGIGAFGAFSILVIALLALVVPVWAAALIELVVYGAIATVAALGGKKRLDEVTSPVPERSVQSIREDVRAVRQGVAHGR
jgi:hypothetical protein